MGGRGGSSALGNNKNGTKLLNTSDFPKLSGSEKQVKWAEQIRQEAVEKVNSVIRFEEGRLKKNPGISTYKDNLEAAKQISQSISTVFKKLDSASKIIDNRSIFTKNMIQREIDNISNQISRKRR